MFRRINIKLLAGIFVVLLVFVVLIEVIDAQRGNRTFKSDLVNVPADQVTSVEIYPKATNGKLIKLFKENESWKLESEGKRYNADQAAAERLITQLNEMKAKSVAAANKDRWEQFEVTDSLGTRVKLLKGSDILADVIIGKFTYAQPRSMTSYVRLSDDKEVYGVEGMLGMSFNRNLNSFRDRTIIKSNKADWTKLTYSYPADSSFVLEKLGEKWMIGDMEADSASVARYFNKISNLNDGKFTDKNPGISLTHHLSIEGNNMMQTVEISGYRTDNENFYLETNLNPETLFNSVSSAEKLFVSAKDFIQK